MRYTKIAFPQPFSGKPKFNAPSTIGASPNKPILYRIPIIGERPLEFTAVNLPEGLTLDTKGIISGIIKEEGQYTVSIQVKNSLGTAFKDILFEIAPDNVVLTPLLGFTSWNAYFGDVNQEKILFTAKLISENGMAEYGYSYINIDSTWQGQYGGKYNAVMPNEKFPDMQGLCKAVHDMGLKCGIYSTPMLNAWGLAEAAFGLPGCTQGVVDTNYSDNMGGIGKEHYEQNNVDQWTEWGFDYLKYDWSPCDTENADLMKQCLLKSTRDFAYCVTVRADEEFADYWKRNCTSWRDNLDSDDIWERLCKIFLDADRWSKYIGKGHFFDLDMLEIGNINGRKCRLSQDEQIFAYSIRAIFPSPIQLSCQVDLLDEFETAVICNEEIIAVNQDPLTRCAELIKEVRTDAKHIKIYIKDLSDGGYAVGIFNFGETEESEIINIPGGKKIRDLWAKEDITAEKSLEINLMPHTVRMLKIYDIEILI